MFIGQLPKALRNIRDDGRTNDELIASLEAQCVAVFHKDLLAGEADPIPPPGTVYPFLGVSCRELSKDLRGLGAERILAAITQEHGEVRKPSLRSLLFLMERMSRKGLYADIVVMNEPVPCHEGTPVLISLGHADEEGQPWVAAVGVDYTFPHDRELILVLAPPA